MKRLIIGRVADRRTDIDAVSNSKIKLNARLDIRRIG